MEDVVVEPLDLALQQHESYSSDDEQQDPLDLSGIHMQLAALLQQIQDPLAAADDCQAAGANSSACGASPGGAVPAYLPKSPICCDEAAALPAWLADRRDASEPGMEPGADATPAARQLSSSRAFLAAPGSGTQGTAACSYSCRRPVPEWLVSPVCGASPDARDRRKNPFHALIAEIDANLAASGAPYEGFDAGGARRFADLLEEAAAELAPAQTASWQGEQCAGSQLSSDSCQAAKDLPVEGVEEGGACSGSSCGASQDWLGGTADGHRPELAVGSPVRSPGSLGSPAGDAAVPLERLLEEPEQGAAEGSPAAAACISPAKSPSPEEPGVAVSAANEDGDSAQPQPAPAQQRELRIDVPAAQVGVRILRRSVSPQQVANCPEGGAPAVGGNKCSIWAVHGSAACEHPWPASCRAEAACFGDKDDKENVSPLRPASAPVLARRRALAELPTSEVLARDGVGSPPATADDVQLRLPDIQVFYEAGACECEVSGGLPPAECVATPGAQARVQEEEVDADAASLGQPGHAQVQLEALHEGINLPQGVHAAGGAEDASWRVAELEAAKGELEAQLRMLTGQLAQRDERLAQLRQELSQASQMVHAHQREVELLQAESLGLQDVLSEAGAEATARAAHQAETERLLAAANASIDRARSSQCCTDCPAWLASAQSTQARMMVQGELAEDRAALHRCRADLARTERELGEARVQAAATAAAAAPASPPAAEAAAPQAGTGAMKAPDSAAEDNAAPAGEEVVNIMKPRREGSLAQELVSAIITPMVVEHRAATRAASVSPSPAQQLPASQAGPLGTPLFRGGVETPAWAAATPSFRAAASPQPRAAAQGPRSPSAWDVPSAPSPINPASQAALATVLGKIRAREQEAKQALVGSAGDAALLGVAPVTPLAAFMRRMSSSEGPGLGPAVTA